MRDPHKLPRRLRRLPAIWTEHESPRFFLTICTADRETVLANPTIHERLLEFLRDSRQRYGWWAGRYVLMPDHIHLLAARTQNAVALGAWVKALKSVVSRREFRWETGFFDHVLRNRESEWEKWEYIRQNPVRAGLVKTPEEWPFAGELSESL